MITHHKQILEAFLGNLACLADKSYQERVWVRAEGPECDDIDDTVCDFFDDDFVIKKYKDYSITEDQIKSLIKLHENLRVFTDTYGGPFQPRSATNS
jgi:hypothetical protein